MHENSRVEKAQPPLLVITMGVSGCGKSSLARALADRFGFHCLDADDFHSEEARARMAKGIPLDDEIRAPWIVRIREHLQQLAHRGESCVLAFSGLKKSYREPLRHTDFKVIYLFMDGDKETIRQRMEAREGHFMPTTLLDSQFETLERPVDEPDVFTIDITLPFPQMVEQAAAVIQERADTEVP